MQNAALMQVSHRVLWTVIIMAAALLGSCVGFSDLIGVVYPIFGYCGVGFLLLLTIHWIHKRKELAV